MRALRSMRSLELKMEDGQLSLDSPTPCKVLYRYIHDVYMMYIYGYIYIFTYLYIYVETCINVHVTEGHIHLHRI